jgi:hypothetical protein
MIHREAAAFKRGALRRASLRARQGWTIDPNGKLGIARDRCLSAMGQMAA